MDIEEIAVEGGALWAARSHSLKRDTPGRDDEAAHALEALRSVTMDPDRHLLDRAPLVERSGGVFEPVRELALASGPARTASIVELEPGTGRTLVRSMLAENPPPAPFVDVPCTENGFDVEGLAVQGERVAPGLRGPVIGERAVLVEMRLKQTGRGFLKPRRIGPSGACCRPRFVDLDGFGVRGLLLDGDELLLLAGPMEDIDGIQCVLRLPSALGDAGPVVRRGAVERVLRLPIREGCDHAGRLALLACEGGGRELPVAHDSPADDRLDGTGLEVDCYDA